MWPSSLPEYIPATTAESVSKRDKVFFFGGGEEISHDSFCRGELGGQQDTRAPPFGVVLLGSVIVDLLAVPENQEQYLAFLYRLYNCLF